MFSDESKFLLYKDDGRLYKWPGQRFKQALLKKKSHTELVLVKNCSLNDERYVEEILIEHVGSFMESMGANVVLVHNNARSYTAGNYSIN